MRCHILHLEVERIGRQAHGTARYEAADGGIYLELEATGLTRGIPLGGPAVRRVSAEVPETSPQQMRETLERTAPMRTVARGRKIRDMDEPAAAERPPLAERVSAVRTAARALRRSEWVVIIFLLYAAVMAFLLPVAAPVRYRVVAINAMLLLAYVPLVREDRARPSLALSVVRDWLPLAIVILAYREMGWFALPQHGHALEARWVVWDRMVLRGGLRAAIEAFGPVLPALLEIAYALVYALAPFSLAMLYVYHRRGEVDRFLSIFALGVLLCYAQFPFWPSEPPRTVYFGQDFPLYNTIFRRFNWWMLGEYGIHTSVFPSAHVAGAFSAAFGMWISMPRPRWVAAFLLVMAVLIATATVYGRYHYLADAAAGFAMAVLSLAFNRAGGRPRATRP